MYCECDLIIYVGIRLINYLELKLLRSITFLHIFLFLFFPRLNEVYTYKFKLDGLD